MDDEQNKKKKKVVAWGTEDEEASEFIFKHVTPNMIDKKKKKRN